MVGAVFLAPGWSEGIKQIFAQNKTQRALVGARRIASRAGALGRSAKPRSWAGE